jgi:hypothetical protein
LKAAAPDKHFNNPVARLTIPHGSRNACCDSDKCSFCPTGAKFTALNTLGYLFDNPQVEICVECRVERVDTAAGVAQGLHFVSGGRERSVKGDLVALACNAIQTPFIMMRSGLHHQVLGRYLHEKRIVQVEVLLDGLNHFDGGTAATGINVSFLDGPHRRDAAGAVIFILNSWRDNLRPEYGRWRQVLPLEIFVEDLPLETNRVFDDGGAFPAVTHASRSDYCSRGVDRVLAGLPAFLAPLPVEKIRRVDDALTGSHVQGTARMGRDQAQSIVDGDLVHHQVRNLLVLGTAVFPSCGVVNPSLTAAALSLRAAARLAA